MELLFILLFAANLFELTKAKHMNQFEDEEYSQEYNEEYDTDYNKEYEEEDDLFELPPNIHNNSFVKLIAINMVVETVQFSFTLVSCCLDHWLSLLYPK